MTSRDAVGNGVLVTLNDAIGCAHDMGTAHSAALDTFRSPERGILGWMDNGAVRCYRAPTRRENRRAEKKGAHQRPS